MFLSRSSILLALIFCLAISNGLSAEDPVSFKNVIAPLLFEQCIGCHGPRKSAGNWRADTFARLGAAGESTTAGFGENLDESEAWRRIVSDDPHERMPLDAEPLSPEQIASLKTWIEAGRPFDGPDEQAPLWTFLPPTNHSSPPESYPSSLPITAVAFNADGSELFAAGYHEVTVWNVESGSLARRIPNLPQRIYQIAVSPDGNLLAVAGGNPGRLGEVRLFQAASGELQRVLAVSPDVDFAVAFRPDGKQLASGGADGLVRIFEVDSGAELKTLRSHSDWIFDLAWNAEGTQLASASRDGTAKVFQADSGKLVVSFDDHKSPVRGVIFDDDGKHAFSSGENRRLYRWQISDGKKIGEINLGGAGGNLFAAGKAFLSVSQERVVQLISLESDKEIRQFKGLSDWGTAAAFDPQHQRVAGGAFNGEIVLWKFDSGEEERRFLALPGRP